MELTQGVDLNIWRCLYTISANYNLIVIQSEVWLDRLIYSETCL